MSTVSGPGSRARRASAGVAGVMLLAVVLAACGGAPLPATSGQVSSSAGAPGPASAAPPPQTQPQASLPEVNPAGDIPDTQAYVPFSSLDGLFTVSIPEGWARSSEGPATVFTDKLNTVRIEAAPRPAPPTVDSARAQELPALAGSVAGFAPGQVSTVTRPAGPAVLITYQAGSPPDPVTGKSRLDAVERYEFFHADAEVALTLSGPVGADNVDPYRMITDSLRWLR